MHKKKHPQILRENIFFLQKFSNIFYDKNIISYFLFQNNQIFKILSDFFKNFNFKIYDFNLNRLENKYIINIKYDDKNIIYNKIYIKKNFNKIKILKFINSLILMIKKNYKIFFKSNILFDKFYFNIFNYYNVLYKIFFLCKKNFKLKKKKKFFKFKNNKRKFKLKKNKKNLFLKKFKKNKKISKII